MDNKSIEHRVRLNKAIFDWVFSYEDQSLILCWREQKHKSVEQSVVNSLVLLGGTMS